MRKTTYICINDHYFEYQKKPMPLSIIECDFKHASGKTLYDVYEEPSVPKRKIWEAWHRFFNGMDIIRMAVATKNTYTFTIIAETKHFYFFISAGHDRVWLKENYEMIWTEDEDRIITPLEFIVKD